MPDIVSPTNLPATVDPSTPYTASDELSPPPDTSASSRAPSEDGNIHPSPGQRVNPDATPHTNGHGPPDVNGGDGDSSGHDNDESDRRPSKRRRTRDTTPLSTSRKPKFESPPWKKIEAEGPTSFTENGRRKSGRINALSVEPPPPSKKRPARHSLNGSVASTPKKNGLPACANGPRSANGRERPQSARKVVSTPKPAIKKPAPPSRSSSRSVRRQTPSPRPQPTRHSTRPRRAARLADNPESRNLIEPSHELRQTQHDDDNQSPRIRLRVGRPGIIPLVHPDQVRKRPKIGTSFADFWERGGKIPVEEGGLLASEDGPSYTDEMAQRDARWILRIEQEAEPGGLLSQDRCSLFTPEGEEEPPRQWARQDHMVRAMANFRKLLLAEQQRHRATAKKLAEACRDEWLRRQPKSAEEIEAEEREKWTIRYRLVARAICGTWENVRTQVNRQRLEQWEAEEQKRVKAALNEAVSLSEQKLQARRGGLDSEVPSDGDGFDDLSDDISVVGGDDEEPGPVSGESDEGGVVEDSDYMSSSDGDDGDDDDEGGLRGAADEELTQEQLRSKYAHLPDLEQDTDDVEDDDLSSPGAAAEKPDAESADDASDESVDMDDDLGSSDSDSGSAIDNESDASDGDEPGDGAGGLLGLFFGKSELEQMKAEAANDTDQLHESDTVMLDADGPGTTKGLASDAGAPASDGYEDDDDRMSLVRHPDSINGDAAETEHGPVVELSQDQALERPEDASANGHLAPAKSEVKVPSVDQAANLPPANEAKPIGSPETESVTIPASRDRSQSPPTSETKPSELDVSSAADRAAVNEETDRSSSTPTPARHKTEIPFLLRGTLREYQHDGLDWLAGLYANSTNGILADEMGLGKTIQTIALLAHLACHHEVWGPHLVVVPTSVMLNWEMEFKKWCPGFKILAYYGSQEERKRKRQGWNNDDVWNVCITSYQLVLQDQQVFKRRRWHYMILDEAHNIKNFKSQRWQTLLGFNTHSRLLLTGTPLQNNLTELWSLLFFLMPAENGVGGFADLQEFHDWFHKPESQILESGRDQMDDEARAIISKLHKVLRPYLLRRLKADVEKQMPAKYEHVEFCRLSKRQRELYDGFLSRSDTKETLASGNYLSIINCLMQLRKVCNHPDLFVDRPITTSFRMKKSVVADFEFTERSVRRLLHPGDPMGVVSLSFLNLIPTEHERISSTQAERVAQLSSHRVLTHMREAQRTRAQAAYMYLDPSTVESSIAYLESAARWDRFEELQHCVYLNALRRQQRPIYGKNLVDLKVMAWFENDSTFVRSMIPTLDERADSFKTRIEKFSGVEAFTDEDLKLSAPVRWAPFLPKEAPVDPWHEARMRLSIHFPDRRLLQYDCGKLQVLDKLLRKLQAGGHRVLIFTQMTKVLDILEQFLNIHGHKYLRLDGATKVEQRQIMTDRFNNDSRILCFILSTRSGGLGINLTGADTVIFYDQDWNPAMDKQCQDRCHRIGQTRDVHIYRLVSEHTIEANILRKASQKQMLDDVVIQEGEFTTDYFNRLSVRDVLEEKADFTSEGVSAADAALDRVLGGPDSSGNQERRNVGRALEQAEDREDVAAARVAEREIQADDADFTEKPSGPASGASTTRQGTPSVKSIDGVDLVEAEDEAEVNAWGDKIGNIDQHMLNVMAEQLKGTKLELPKDKKKGKKKGKDTRKR
ncbi:type III restriction enzyme, res subunit [Hirsutella rhossiliensis]|uniref:DNA helicase n=1 Tax=Hirsutella rhossiliensis TaxID=111463 RepID=A0A9P8SJ43_9HYPO|nr:type III restriction enzyme, res subunit domain-containing protein [Hirsutella rhossiliensis]KAH0962676.1 type III restriction enzyme, res subunit domain-containing protein [Hirsutella rhossiliensis]